MATKSKESLLTQEAASSLPLPPPPTQEKATVSQPKEPVVEEVTPSPLLPTVSKPTQVNVVSSVRRRCLPGNGKELAASCVRRLSLDLVATYSRRRMKEAWLYCKNVQCKHVCLETNK